MVFTVALAVGFTACTKANGVVIAVPNDTTNEARALMLLEQQGFIKLKEGAGITATVRDIVENPYNIKFKEVEAAQLPNFLQDVDFAVINSNFALAANLIRPPMRWPLKAPIPPTATWWQSKRAAKKPPKPKL